MSDIGKQVGYLEIKVFETDDSLCAKCELEGGAAPAIYAVANAVRLLAQKTGFPPQACAFALGRVVRHLEEGEYVTVDLGAIEKGLKRDG